MLPRPRRQDRGGPVADPGRERRAMRGPREDALAAAVAFIGFMAAAGPRVPMIAWSACPQRRRRPGAVRHVAHRGRCRQGL